MGNLGLRLLSAVVLLPASVAAILFAPPIAFALFIAVIAAMCGFELGRLVLDAPFRGHAAGIAVLSGASALAVGLASVCPAAPLVGLGLVPMAALLLFMFSANDLTSAARGALAAAAGSVYCGALPGFAALLLAMEPHGREWVIALLACAVAGDTGAYAVGGLVGRRKLAPRLSPGKTWEGAVGGLAATLLAAGIVKLFLIEDLGAAEALLLGAALSIACQLGDLAESFLKRGFGAKDSGTLIPGHGGILDRMDSLLFGAPVAFLFAALR